MRYSQMQSLYTDEFILRAMKKSDYKDLFEYYSQEYVLKYLPIKPHKTYLDTKKFIEAFFIKNYKMGKIGHYAVVDKKTNRVIGNMGFNNISKNCKSGEIGICINPDYWGNNLSVSLFKLLIDYGFNKLHLNSIYAVVYDENIYSKKSLEKLGFKYEKSFYKKDKYNQKIKCDKYILYKI